MKLLLLLAASLWLLGCKKEPAGLARKLDRRIEVYNDSSSLTTAFEYDARGRIVTIKTAVNNQPLQPALTVTYSGNEASVQFQPYREGTVNVSRQLRLVMDPNGKLLQRIFHAEKTDLSNPSFTEQGSSVLNLSYTAAGFLQTAIYHRFDSAYRPGSIWTSRDSFVTQYTTINGRLTRVDQTGGTIYTIDNGTLITASRTKEYHTVFSYTQQQPNNFDCSNAAILNQVTGFGFTEQYYDVNVFEPIADAIYQYMPDRIQKQALEKDENGNITIGFSSDVQVERTYNEDGMLETTEVLTPDQGMKRIRYMYVR